MKLVVTVVANKQQEAVREAIIRLEGKIKRAVTLEEAEKYYKQADNLFYRYFISECMTDRIPDHKRLFDERKRRLKEYAAMGISNIIREGVA